ncbi:MAG: hypothetical protein ACO1OB_31735 [Archangium sp.]
MSSSNHESDPNQLPVPFKARPGDIEHHKREWTSGSRGGGSIPKDFGWNTNPKQQQEENGAGTLKKPVSK